MQKLGQHFLKNSGVIQKTITALEIKTGETVIEIGTGHGELTIPLAEYCKKIGARLISIEKDEKLFSETNRLEIQEVTFLQGDALALVPELASAELQDFKLVGNIPYYLTGHLFRIIGELTHKPVSCVFMIQKEVAERACALPPKMNRLSASLQFWSIPKIIVRVPKSDFSPPPKIDSAVITLQTKTGDFAEAENYYRAMRILFAQPRKTILNNLKAGLPGKSLSLEEIGIKPELRPQNLAVEDIVRIAQKFFPSSS
jgi:16S rRNA (adenine1518-N6/adenine1519-N6)-dimethyltransferase